MAVMSVGSSEIYYELHGAGPLAVFISGLGSDHSAWCPVISELRSSFSCLVYDNRGIGKSSLGLGERNYSIELLADDLRDLLDVVGAERAHIVGQSMGGTVAQAFALAYPDRVASLGLHVTWARLRPRLRLIFQEQLYYSRIMDLPDVVRLLGPLVWSEYTLEHRQEMIMELRKNRPATIVSPDVYERQTHACLQFDALESLSELNVPTLVTAASEDLLVPVEYATEIARAIEGSQYHIFERCGHAVTLERVEEFVSVVHEFIQSAPIGRQKCS